MQIHELAAKTTVANTDVFAVDSGSATNKVSSSTLKATYGVAIYLSVNTWEDIYNKLSAIPNGGSGTFYANGPQSTLTGGYTTSTLRGVVSRNGSSYDFVGSSGAGTGQLSWRISDLTSSGGTVSPVYNTIGMSIFAADASSWSELYALLSKYPGSVILPLYLASSVAAIATNNKVTGANLYGYVRKTSDSSGDFFNFTMSSTNGQYIYQWTISGASASERTTGTVYRFSGTAL